MDRPGHSTNVESEAVSSPSLVVSTEAVLSYWPQLSAVVELTTWTQALAPAANVVGAKARLWFGAVPVIENGFPADCDSIDQSMPSPPGSASRKVRPVARPVPLLLIVTVKPISEPASTEAASATLATSISAQSTS